MQVAREKFPGITLALTVENYTHSGLQAFQYRTQLSQAATILAVPLCNSHGGNTGNFEDGDNAGPYPGALDISARVNHQF